MHHRLTELEKKLLKYRMEFHKRFILACVFFGLIGLGGASYSLFYALREMATPEYKLAEIRSAIHWIGLTGVVLVFFFLERRYLQIIEKLIKE